MLPLRGFRGLLCLLAAGLLPASCGGSDESAPTDTAGGASGQGGAAGGSAGQAAVAGHAGQSGSAGTTGGAAGGGAGGAGGLGGAGSSAGGSAGNAGSGAGGGAGGAGMAGGAGASGAAGAGGGDGCGALVAGDFTRCARNSLRAAGALYAGTYARAQGKRVLGFGDPDVIVDEAEPDPARRWKAYWSVTYGMAFGDDDTTDVMGIQAATSADGVTWEVGPEPALWAGEDGAWDHLKIETPSVVVLPAQAAGVGYVMLYSGAGAKKALAAGNALPWYQLGLAVSADGVHWTKLPAAQSPYGAPEAGFSGRDGLVLLGKDAFDPDPAVADGLAADPEIALENGVFHAFFSSFAVDQGGAIAFPTAYGMSHATSTDAIHWTRQPKNPQIFGATQPSLITKADGSRELYVVADSDQEIAAKEPNTFNAYLGVRRVVAASLDGFHDAWMPDSPRFFSWDGAYVPEKWGLVKAGDMVLHDGVYHYFYIGMGGDASTIPPGYFTTVTPATPGAKPAGSLWVVDSVASLNLARRPE